MSLLDGSISAGMSAMRCTYVLYDAPSDRSEQWNRDLILETRGRLCVCVCACLRVCVRAPQPYYSEVGALTV